MVSRRRIVAAITVAVGVTIFAVVFWSPREPTHKGAPLSSWVNRAFRRERPDHADEEIKAIGAPAVPYLIKKLRVRPTLLRRALANVALPGSFQSIDPTYIQDHAAELLGAIGKDAAPAVPDLIDVLSTGSSEIAGRAIRALGEIGPDAKEALPALHSVLTNNISSGWELNAASAIWDIGRETNGVIQACVAAIQTGGFQEQEALALLGRMGPAAREATPVLIGAVRNSKATTVFGYRCEAVTALCEVSDSREATPVLVELIVNTNEVGVVRERAAFELGQLKIRDEQVLAALRTVTQETGFTGLRPVANCCAFSLWRLDNWRASDPFMPAAVKYVLQRYWPERDRPIDEWSFVQIAANIGFNAKATVPALTKLLSDPDPDVREGAAKALSQIGSKDKKQG